MPQPPSKKIFPPVHLPGASLLLAEVLPNLLAVTRAARALSSLSRVCAVSHTSAAVFLFGMPRGSINTTSAWCPPAPLSIRRSASPPVAAGQEGKSGWQENPTLRCSATDSGQKWTREGRQWHSDFCQHGAPPLAATAAQQPVVGAPAPTQSVLPEGTGEANSAAALVFYVSFSLSPLNLSSGRPSGSVS